MSRDFAINGGHGYDLVHKEPPRIRDGVALWELWQL